MGTAATVLVVVLVLAAAGVAAYVGYQADQRRSAALAALAGAHGWSYQRDSDDLDNRYVGEPFGRGDRRHGRHALHGQHRDQEVTAFEYSFTTTSGTGKDRRTTTHRYALAGVALPREVPQLQLTREHLGTALLGAVGLRDLQLESSAFNDAFRISTDDDRFAYAVLHPRAMEWMLAEPRLQDLPLRFERADLITWTQGRLDPAWVLPALELLCDLREQVPAHAFDPR